MNELLLINCPPWGVAMPPLGVAYLTTYLKANSVTVQVCDLNFALYRAADPKARELWDLRCIAALPPTTVAERLFCAAPQVIEDMLAQCAGVPLVGFSANNILSAAFAGICCRRLRERFADAITIIGGAGCRYSWDRRRTEQAAVDCYVIGEGELPLLRLVQAWRRRPDRRQFFQRLDVAGVLLGPEHSFKPYRLPEFIADINTIPAPTFEEFDVAAYARAGLTPAQPALPVLFSRGCINRCAYCIDFLQNPRFRTRSPTLIHEEIQTHLRRYGTRRFECNDLLCNGDLRHLEAVADALIRADQDITWSSYAAVRGDMTLELLKKMRAAGCRSLCYGVETASDEILRRMNKRYTAADIQEILRRTQAAGISARINLIVGFPGERDTHFAETLDFLAKNRQYIEQVTNVSAFVLMPDADVGIYARRYGVTVQNADVSGAWRDAFGLEQGQRNQRVITLCEALRELGIAHLIVNMNPETVQAIPEVPPLAAAHSPGNHPVPTNAQAIRLLCCRRSFIRMVLGGVILSWLVMLSVFSDCYLWVLKKYRGSIIFPGG